MKQVVGIRFSEFGQIKVCAHEFADAPLALGQGVVVDGEHGLSFGRVVWRKECPASCGESSPEMSGEMSPIESLGAATEKFPRARVASPDEIASAVSNQRLSRDAYDFCHDCIRERALDMKLVDVEVLLDKSKIIFYFTAPTRIDFRELVKDLVRQYRTRIELRQIGVRHETQMLGALGNCGMVVCCRRYLKSFAPVTIKMAKEQNLFLNPAKISGICGRLLCCLSFEQENYDVFHRSCPKLGKRYQTTRGYLRVLRSNMFRNSVVVLPEEGGEEEMTLEEWGALNPHRSEQPASPVSAREAGSYDFMVVSASPDTLEKDLASLLEEDSRENEEKGKPRRTAPHPREKNLKRPSFDSEAE